MREGHDGPEDGGVAHRLGRGLTGFSVALLCLVSLEPFISFFDQNRGQYVQVEILVQLALATLALVALVYVVLLVALPRADPRRIAAGLGGFVFCFFRYSVFNEDGARPLVVTLGAWALLTAAVVVTIVLWSRHEAVRLFLVLFLAVFVLMPTVSVASHELGDEEVVEPTEERREPIAVADTAVRTPDVWWFVLDEYGRADALEHVFDFDNGSFLDELDRRGFRVSDESFTSYPVTPLSIASVLEMEHVVSEEADAKLGFRSFTEPLKGDSRVVDALREHGYRYLYADNGVFDWSECDADLVDVCVPAPSTGVEVGHLTRTVAELTPLVELFSVPRPDPEWTVRRAQREMDDDTSELVFAHVLSPHEPYWFTDDCDYRSQPLHGGFDAERYVNEVRCLNPRVLDAVDAITDADPDAIVIIQSDHGTIANSSMTLPYGEWDESALADRYSILEAMRFPAECSTPEGPHSNVSTFEYVLACLEGRPPEPLEERYFYWRWTAQAEVVEIDRPASVPSN